jgi:hypothetical protein
MTSNTRMTLGQALIRRLRDSRPSHVIMSWVAHRRMRDPQFRQQQVDDLRAPHVAPINALMDELIDPSGRGWVPYVAPVYGGVDASVLNIHRDPGPKPILSTAAVGSCARRTTTPARSGSQPCWTAWASRWVRRCPGTPTPGTSIACREQPNCRPVSSRYGGYLVSSQAAGGHAPRRVSPRRLETAGTTASQPGMWGSKSCPPITPAVRHSSVRPTSGQHAWHRCQKRSHEPLGYSRCQMAHSQSMIMSNTCLNGCLL